MELKIPDTPEKYTDYLQTQRDEASDLRHEINRSIGDSRVEEIRGKRVFLQNIVITSATLLGFVSAFSLIGNGGEINNPYFAIGIGLHLFLICFITLYLREAIDREIEELMRLQDNYSEIMKYQVELAQKYILAFIHDQTNIPQKFKSYHDELLSSPEIEKIKKQNEELDKGRADRKAQKLEYEFNAEIAIFSFLSGTILIFLSVLGKNPSILNMLFGFVILFYVTFTDFLHKWSIYIFKALTFITRRNLN